MKSTITKEQFKEYLDVQESGLYNMIDPRARELTSLSRSQWINILTNYNRYSEKWNM
tara:strand:+ start:485 stop:655 length:171 start_codon:yes stop_codon:yes gene_type:complete